jgi:hypothetical protein
MRETPRGPALHIHLARSNIIAIPDDQKRDHRASGPILSHGIGCLRTNVRA